MMMTSASTPCFLNKPFSSATQMLPEVALTELRPTRILSWAWVMEGKISSAKKQRRWSWH
jgi:hypothetical protein